MVERDLAKVEVASSRLVSRSIHQGKAWRFPFFTCIPARWQSGYAAACKAVYLGSIPGRASIDTSLTRPSRPGSSTLARMVKQVDTRDLKSLGFGHAGSSPAPGTISIHAGFGGFALAQQRPQIPFAAHWRHTAKKHPASLCHRTGQGKRLRYHPVGCSLRQARSDQAGRHLTAASALVELLPRLAHKGHRAGFPCWRCRAIGRRSWQ